MDELIDSNVRGEISCLCAHLAGDLLVIDVSFLDVVIFLDACELTYHREHIDVGVDESDETAAVRHGGAVFLCLIDGSAEMELSDVVGVIIVADAVGAALAVSTRVEALLLLCCWAGELGGHVSFGVAVGAVIFVDVMEVGLVCGGAGSEVEGEFTAKGGRIDCEL